MHTQAHTITSMCVVYTRRQACYLMLELSHGCSPLTAGPAQRRQTPLSRAHSFTVCIPRENVIRTLRLKPRPARPHGSLGRTQPRRGSTKWAEDERRRRRGRALFLTRTRSGPGSGQGSSGRDVSGGGAWGRAEEPDAISSWRGASP